MGTIIAYDLETVPDVDFGRRVWGLEGEDEAVAAAMAAKRLEETDGKTDFLKVGMHRIVAVGVAGVAFNTGAPAKVRISARCSRDEQELLEFFLATLSMRPQLVSWNGGGFDLPVIRYRALLHGVNAGLLYGPVGQRQYESYAYRYGETHLDLMDVLSGYGASTALKLDEAAQLAGLPAKGDVSGADVSRLWLTGGGEAIARYVGHDAAKTLLLFLRFQWTRGHIRPEVYAETLDAIDRQLSDREDNLELRKAIGTWRLAAMPEMAATG